MNETATGPAALPGSPTRMEICPRCEDGLLATVETTHEVLVEGSLVRIPRVRADECPACGYRSLSGREARLIEVLFTSSYERIGDLVSDSALRGLPRDVPPRGSNRDRARLRIARVGRESGGRFARTVSRQRDKPRTRWAAGPGRAGGPRRRRTGAPPHAAEARRGRERNGLQLRRATRRGLQGGQAQTLLPRPPARRERTDRVLRRRRHPGAPHPRERSIRTVRGQAAAGRPVARGRLRSAGRSALGAPRPGANRRAGVRRPPARAVRATPGLEGLRQPEQHLRRRVGRAVRVPAGGHRPRPVP